MKLVLIALVVLAVSGFARAEKNSKCLPPFGKVPFDEVKFSGQWYIVGRLSTNAMSHLDITCSKVEYSVKDDGNITRINMALSMKVDGEEMKFVSTGQPPRPQMKSVTQTMFRKETEKEWKGVIMQSILATDYTSFAIFYACKPVYVELQDTFDKMQWVNIWSRTPQMEETLFKVITNVLSSYDFDVTDMVQEDHTKC